MTIKNSKLNKIGGKMSIKEEQIKKEFSNLIENRIRNSSEYKQGCKETKQKMIEEFKEVYSRVLNKCVQIERELHELTNIIKTHIEINEDNKELKSSLEGKGEGK
jgi:hypothetical protein